MNRLLSVLAVSLSAALPGLATAAPAPVQSGWPLPMHTNMPTGKAMLNQNEYRGGDGASLYRWEGEAWYGWNLNRFWLRSEGSLNTNTSLLDEAEVQALYSRAITTYFDLQAGVRHDFDPRPSRDWLTLGVNGLAPMFWDFGAYLFVRDRGHVAARVEASYDLFLTQRLVLQPQFEFNAYTRNERSRGIGGGLSSLDSGLRLRYEIRRQFAPYVGLTYARQYGRTADFLHDDGEATSALQYVAGVRIWF